MSSAVYFKFKASIKQYTIPFDGSAISVKDLRSAIRLSCGLKSTDFELQIVDKQGKEYSKEDDLIPKFSDLVVRRLPKVNDLPRKKIANPEDMTRRDPYKAINSLAKINPYSNSINLAKSNIPDDEKIDIMAKRCSEEYSEKNFLVKSKPYGIPPASYVCNKCHQGGHWIHECPGLRDKDGRLLDFKSVKRPTGIPQDFLLEVSPGTPGAYLTKEGKYMVPIKDAEAYAKGKKEKRPFSIEENPPYVSKDQEFPSKIKCSLCSKLLENPTCTPCCSSVYCEKCITDYLYDPDVNGSRQCPNCQSIIEHHTSLIEHELMRQLIQCWKANMLTKEIVDSCVTTLNHSSNKKTELHEDSSKSPDMKFDSANSNHPDNLSVKTELEKVFVNNRRVLKPKTSNQMRTESPSNIKPSSPDKLGEHKIEIINSLSSLKPNENSPEDTVKVEKVASNNNLSEIDVNDLIFEKVQDFDSVPGGVLTGEVTRASEKPEAASGPFEKSVVRRTNSEQNLKIEIVSKQRSDNNGLLKMSSDGGRKVDVTKMSGSGRMDNCGGSSGACSNNMKVGHMNSMSSDMHQHQTSFMNTAAGDTPGSQLLNHYPTTTQLVTSAVQQQMLNNPIAINTMEPLQWPLINSMYGNMGSLHSIFGGAAHAAQAAQAAMHHASSTNPSGWLANGPINIVPPIHPAHATSTSRILTKEEFYERQRRLRAEKMKQKYHHRDGSSRSPSGSQSPRHRRKHRSRSEYHDHADYSSSSHNKDKVGTASGGHYDRKHFKSVKDEPVVAADGRERRSSRQQYASSSGHRHQLNSQHKNQQQQLHQQQLQQLQNHDTFKDRGPYKTSSQDYENEDIKKIDPKLMEDSINTFLKYLTVPPETSMATGSDKKLELGPDCKFDKYDNGRSARHKQPQLQPQHRTSSSNNLARISHASMNIEDDGHIHGVIKNVASRTKSRRSTRSRSVPRISKDRLVDDQRTNIISKYQPAAATATVKREKRDVDSCHSEPPEPKRDIILRRDHKYRDSPPSTTLSDHVPAPDDTFDAGVLTATDMSAGCIVKKEKKTKKSKHRDAEHSDDNDDTKRKRKHKKHKHKKMKKVKKEKRDN